MVVKVGKKGLDFGGVENVVRFAYKLGAQVELQGLNEASATMVDKFAVHDKHDGHDVLIGH
jgi:SulP family sulfate permease